MNKKQARNILKVMEQKIIDKDYQNEKHLKILQKRVQQCIKTINTPVKYNIERPTLNGKEYTLKDIVKAIRYDAKNIYKIRCNQKNAYKARTELNSKRRGNSLRLDTSCKRCGSTKNIQYHHEDYNRPLEVIALCIRCHHKRHKEIRSEILNKLLDEYSIEYNFNRKRIVNFLKHVGILI